MEIQEQLSPNIECKWKIYRSIIPEKDYNIISVSFFKKKVKGSMNNKKKYFEGLKKTYYSMRKILPHYILRIYCDESVIEETFKFYKKVNEDHIELFVYHIPLLIEDTYYHKGTTGTLWRFLPLLKTNIHKCDKKLVLDIDSDDKYNNELFLKIIKKIENKKIYFMYMNRPNYAFKPRIKHLDKKKKDFFNILGGFIYQINEIDYKIFSDFLERYFVNISNKNQYKIKNLLKRVSVYEYGIDEIFLNESFLYCQSKILSDPENFYIKHDYKIYILESMLLSDFYKLICYFLEQYHVKNNKILNKMNKKIKDQDKFEKCIYQMYETFGLVHLLEKNELLHEKHQIILSKYIELFHKNKSNELFLNLYYGLNNKHHIPSINHKIIKIFKNYFFPYIQFKDKTYHIYSQILSLFKFDNYLFFIKSKDKIRHYYLNMKTNI
jgi:hypothetical protein